MDVTSSFKVISTTFFLLVSQHVLASSTMGITSDESSLLSLKSSISYDPQNVIIATNWSSSTSVCSWVGVFCSKKHHSRVTALNISSMDLQGVIPPQLGNLSFLRYLNLSNNRFHGSLPEELSNLRRLKAIDLRNNNFSGQIPSSFGLISKLEALYLEKNEFSGSIPPSSVNLSELQILSLGWNFLDGNIPEALCSLGRLRILGLEANQLTGLIPLCIFNLTNLQKIGFTRNILLGQLPPNICDNLPNLEGLHLSANQLNGSIPPNLQKCSQLKILSLSVNNFTGGLPREIGNLTNLRTLHIGETQLEGELPGEIGKLQKLEVLGLNSCGLGGILPESIFNISSLRIFTLVGNNFTGSLPRNMGQGTPNLQELYMGINDFIGYVPVSISNASKLTILDLSKNQFTGSIPDTLSNLKDLQLLQLGENNFKNPSSPDLSFLSSLTKCRLLKELVIGWNPLTGYLPTSIGNLSSSIEIFSAHQSKLTGGIPKEIGNLSSLTYLNLFGNKLTGSIPATLGGLHKLQQFYLEDNHLTGYLPEEICGMKNLGALHVNLNQFSGPLPACLGNRTSLRILHLDSNRLSSNFPDSIWSLPNLLMFTSSSNMFSGHLPPQIGNWKAVTYVDFSKNRLSGTIPSSIGGLESLLTLSLADNNLEGPLPDSFGRVLSLESLDVSHNYLTGEIPKTLEALIYLKYFNASFNNLSGEIPVGGPFVNFTSQSFISNEALCGASQFQVPQCLLKAVKRPRKRRLHIAVYTAIGVASTILVLIAFVVFKRRRKRNGNNESRTMSRPIGARQMISYNEVQQATNEFSVDNVLGRGGFSSVYKGILRDGTQVAVKVFNMQSEDAFKSFDKECEVLRSLQHRNLTKVISSCTNSDFRALILEYMPNGSLENWIYSNNCFLDSLQRMSICVDVACALDYLHNGYDVPVVHCDIKPSNVLLDAKLVGHLSDFGISRMLETKENAAQTKTMATIGYISPEYGLQGQVSTWSDVYSYGILLMETFARKKPSDDMFSDGSSLRLWIKHSLSIDITKVMDSNLLAEEGNIDAKLQCVSSVMNLALRCTEESPDQRIDMKDVVIALEKIKIQFLSSYPKK